MTLWKLRGRFCRHQFCIGLWCLQYLSLMTYNKNLPLMYHGSHTEDAVIQGILLIDRIVSDLKKHQNMDSTILWIRIKLPAGTVWELAPTLKRGGEETSGEKRPSLDTCVCRESVLQSGGSVRLQLVLISKMVRNLAWCCCGQRGIWAQFEGSICLC